MGRTDGQFLSGRCFPPKATGTAWCLRVIRGGTGRRDLFTPHPLSAPTPVLVAALFYTYGMCVYFLPLFPLLFLAVFSLSFGSGW